MNKITHSDWGLLKKVLAGVAERHQWRFSWDETPLSTRAALDETGGLPIFVALAKEADRESGLHALEELRLAPAADAEVPFRTGFAVTMASQTMPRRLTLWGPLLLEGLYAAVRLGEQKPGFATGEALDLKFIAEALGLHLQVPGSAPVAPEGPAGESRGMA